MLDPGDVKFCDGSSCDTWLKGGNGDPPGTVPAAAFWEVFRVEFFDDIDDPQVAAFDRGGGGGGGGGTKGGGSSWLVFPPAADLVERADSATFFAWPPP